MREQFLADHGMENTNVSDINTMMKTPMGLQTIMDNFDYDLLSNLTYRNLFEYNPKFMMDTYKPIREVHK